MAAEAERNPGKAREWLETFRGSKDWDGTLRPYLAGLAASDPRAAMEMALLEAGSAPPETLERPSEMPVVLSTFLAVARSSPSIASEFLLRIDPKLRRQAVAFARHDVGQAGADPIAWFSDQVAADPTLLDLGSHPRDAEYMMQPLMRDDPLRTLDFIATLPEARQHALREGALASWSSSRADTFLDWLATRPPSDRPKDFKILSSAAQREPERFARWIETLPGGELRERSQLVLAGELAKQGRVDEALRQFPQNSTLDAVAEVAHVLSGALASRDRDMAVRWVNGLTAGSAQAEAAKGLVGAWAWKAPQEAAQWIESLPAGETRDAAAGALGGVLARADPDAATAWVEQIGDPALRASAIGQVFRSWAPGDRAGARAWLREYPGVSEAVKSRLLRSRR